MPLNRRNPTNTTGMVRDETVRLKLSCVRMVFFGAGTHRNFGAVVTVIIIWSFRRPRPSTMRGIEDRISRQEISQRRIEKQVLKENDDA